MTPLRSSWSAMRVRSAGWLTLALLALSFSGLLAQTSPQYSRPDLDARDVIDQDWSNEVPAHLSVIDGPAILERDGQSERATENVPLLAGDRLRTDNGRVEVLFEDGSVLDLDTRTDVEFLSDSLLRLHGGRVRLVLARSSTTLDYRIDAAGTSTQIRTAGEYRVTLANPDREPADVRVTVVRGVAELATAVGRTLIRAGAEAVARADVAPSLPYAVTAAAWDPFNRWADDLARQRRGYESVQYLPAEVRHYSGAFDQYGSWEYDQPYGYVWYPRVAADWRPYSVGRWSFAASFGWFWVGADRWSWPTHHYGRWGLRGARWYWIPERRWAPAWVSWASAPGYLSWCPLGWDNRPVLSFTVSNYRTWGAWTVIPARVFTPNVIVTRYALRDHAGLASSNLRFETGRSAPIRPTTSVRLDSRPLRAPSSEIRTAVPRTGRVLESSSAPLRRSPSDAQTSRGIQDPRSENGSRPRSAAASPTAPASGRRADVTPMTRVPESPVRDTSRDALRAAPRALPRQSAPENTAAASENRRAVQPMPQDAPLSRPALEGRVAAPQPEPRPGATVRSAPLAPSPRSTDPRASEAAPPRLIERRAPMNTPGPVQESAPAWRSRTPAVDAPQPMEPARQAAPRSQPSGGPAESGWSRPNPSRARETPPSPAPAPSAPAPSRVERSSPPAPQSRTAPASPPASGAGDSGERRAAPRRR